MGGGAAKCADGESAAAALLSAFGVRSLVCEGVGRKAGCEVEDSNQGARALGHRPKQTPGY